MYVKQSGLRGTPKMAESIWDSKDLIGEKQLGDERFNWGKQLGRKNLSI